MSDGSLLGAYAPEVSITGVIDIPGIAPFSFALNTGSVCDDLERTVSYRLLGRQCSTNVRIFLFGISGEVCCDLPVVCSEGVGSS